MHLEGKWKAREAKIETGKMTMRAPKHTVRERTESSGGSIRVKA